MDRCKTIFIITRSRSTACTDQYQRHREHLNNLDLTYYLPCEVPFQIRQVTVAAPAASQQSLK